MMDGGKKPQRRIPRVNLKAAHTERISATQDARERLSRIAAELREQSFSASPLRADDAISPEESIERYLTTDLRELSSPVSQLRADDAIYLAESIERYLTGREPSMDRALGLTRGRGAPPSPKVAERNRQLARAVLEKVFQGAKVTDDRIEEGAITAVAETTQLSESTVREAYYKYRVEVVVAKTLEKRKGSERLEHASRLKRSRQSEHEYGIKRLKRSTQKG